GAGVPPVGAWAWRGFSARLRLGIEESPFEHGASGVMRAYGDLETAWTPYPGVMLGATLREYGRNTLAGLNNWVWVAEKPVRSDLPLYALENSAERLHLSLRRSVSPDWHVGFDAGWLEEMYAGFGGEILHQPFGARWAAGGSLYRAWKRRPWDYFRVDYANDATQALATAHYEGEGGAWSASLEAGRYLGGDWGGGAYFTRLLPGEATLRAHAVWTNGPLDQHAQLGGKGEYGLRLSAPLGGLGAAALRYLTGADSYALPLRIDAAARTLGRDAGQKLDRPAPIYDRLSAAGYGRLTGTWGRLLE
ncbi:MAG TPA: YjbH domain-containing protein, partial [Azospirillaceae bacterium]|nr:YjbH domain-containing protein [Azospirillaceae bacterium]